MTTTITTEQFEAALLACKDRDAFAAYTSYYGTHPADALRLAFTQRDERLSELEQQATVIETLADGEKSATLFVNWLRGTVKISEGLQQRIAAVYLGIRADDMTADLAEKIRAITAQR